MDRLAKLFGTFFYTGEFPYAPGTVGSLAGLLLYLSLWPSPYLTAAVFCILLSIGFFAAGRCTRIFAKVDPPQVVIDEVCGIFLTFFDISLSFPSLIIGFLLFRIFDIFKPFPVRRVERLPGAWGIMADDLMCGLYANLVLRFLAGSGVLKSLDCLCK